MSKGRQQSAVDVITAEMKNIKEFIYDGNVRTTLPPIVREQQNLNRALASPTLDVDKSIAAYQTFLNFLQTQNLASRKFNNSKNAMVGAIGAEISNLQKIKNSNTAAPAALVRPPIPNKPLPPTPAQVAARPAMPTRPLPTPPVLKATVDPSMINRPKGRAQSAPPVPERSARVIPPAPPARESAPAALVRPPIPNKPLPPKPAQVAARPAMPTRPQPTPPVSKATVDPSMINRPKGRAQSAPPVPERSARVIPPAPPARESAPAAAKPAIAAKSSAPVLPPKPASVDISADLFNRKSSLSTPAKPAANASLRASSEPSLAATSLQIKPAAKVVESVTRENIQARADAMKDAVKAVRTMSDNYLNKMSQSSKKKNPEIEAKFKAFNQNLDKFVDAIEKVADRNSNSRTGNDTLGQNKAALDDIQKYMRTEISRNMDQQTGVKSVLRASFDRSEPFASMLKVYEAKATVSSGPKQEVEQESRMRHRS